MSFVFSKITSFSEIISCSNIIKLKRVDFIAEALKQITSEVKWIHIGSGDKVGQLVAKIKELPKNIEVELKGKLSYPDVMNLYRSTPASLFVHLSTDEGLPLSLVEAMSFAIPVIATDAGGMSEIVNNERGELIPIDFEMDEFVNLIRKYIANDKLSFEKGMAARRFYEKNFNPDINYPLFIKELRR